MSDFAAKLSALQGRFAGRAKDEAEAIAASLARGDCDALGQRAHRLAGAAPMFGYPELGEMALGLELAIERGEPIDGPASCLVEMLRAISI